MASSTDSSVLRADFMRRVLQGETPRVEEYLARHPSLAGDSEALLDLESLVRDARGDRPALAEYVRRFPHLAEALEQRCAWLRQGGEAMPPTPTPPVDAPRRPPTAHAHRTVAPELGVPVPSPDALVTAPDGYEILRELGRGGMGVVYQARQKSLNRLVALKMVLSGQYAGEEEIVRFLGEAEMVAGLKHPNLVQVYEIGRQGKEPWFAMEYVEGSTLEGVLRGTPLQPRDAAGLLAVLADAVQAAHEQKIVHRDLKPANILLAHSSANRGVALTAVQK